MMNPVPRKNLRTWCEERKNKKLYELQIEACEWAISRVQDSFPKASEDSRRRATEEYGGNQVAQSHQKAASPGMLLTCGKGLWARGGAYQTGAKNPERSD